VVNQTYQTCSYTLTSQMMVLMLLTQGTAANSSFTLLLLLTKVTARQGVKPVVSLREVVLLLGESTRNVDKGDGKAGSEAGSVIERGGAVVGRVYNEC